MFDSIREILNPYKSNPDNQQPKIDNLLSCFNSCMGTIDAYAPELFETIKQDSVYLSLYEGILELKNDDNVSKKTEAQIDTAFKGLTDMQRELLNRFAEALLAKKEEEFESFSSKIEDLYCAVLVDDVGKIDPSSTGRELIDQLSLVVNSKNFPQRYKENFKDIINSLTTSQHNLWCTQNAIIQIKATIKAAPTRAQEIISRQLSPEETIKTLTEELSDEFYVGNFIALFKLYQSNYQINQEHRVDIEDRFRELESSFPKCKELMLLISKWRKALDELEPTTLQDYPLDNFLKLSDQLVSFKNDLEQGAYFLEAKEVILNYLPSLKEGLIKKLSSDDISIRIFVKRTGDSYFDIISKIPKKYQHEYHEIIRLWEKYQSERHELVELWEKYEDHYSKKQSLGQLLVLIRSINEKIADKYTIRSELEEYKIISAILNGTNQQDAVNEINHRFVSEDSLKKIVDKFFFMLMTADSDEQQIDYFKNLTQFLKTIEITPNKAGVSFEKTFKKAITAIFLENLNQPKNFLKEHRALLKFKEHASDLLLLESNEINWFNDLKKAIDDFDQYKLDLDKIKNSYRSTFFLKSSDSKQKAVENLKERIEELPPGITQEKLEKVFNDWEKDFGNIIDKKRYKSGLINNLMDIFHRIQELFSDKRISTKTRKFVNNIKEQMQAILDTTHNPPSSRCM